MQTEKVMVPQTRDEKNLDLEYKPIKALQQQLKTIRKNMDEFGHDIRNKSD